MKPEIEVAAAKLKNEYKCPYSTDDPRVIIWLNGFMEGHKQGCDEGIKALKRLGA